MKPNDARDWRKPLVSTVSLHDSQSSCAGVAQVAFGLPEGIDMDLALEHHLEVTISA
jgi:hypothetical protein